MTLIFTHVHPATGLFAASDVLVSLPSTMKTGGTKIPFRDEPVALSSAGYSPAGLMQKSVTFGRTLITFAGSVLVARAIISKVREVSSDGEQPVEIEQSIADLELSPDEAASVSLIYHFTPDGPYLTIKAYNCESRDLGGPYPIHVAGTGSWNFFENLRDYTGVSLQPAERILAQFLTKMACHPILESTGTETLEHLYGGWFELAYRDSTRFSKVPYAVRMWARDDGVLGTGGPTYFGWYNDHDLIISRIQIREECGVKRLDHRHNNVPDALGRSKSYPPSKIIRPFFVIHLVFSSEHCGVVSTLVDHDIEGKNMLLEVGPKGVSLNWKRHLVEELLNLGVNGSDPVPINRYS